jgi:hypothetical protein
MKYEYEHGWFSIETFGNIIDIFDVVDYVPCSAHAKSKVREHSMDSEVSSKTSLPILTLSTTLLPEPTPKTIPCSSSAETKDVGTNPRQITPMPSHAPKSPPLGEGRLAILLATPHSNNATIRVFRVDGHRSTEWLVDDVSWTLSRVGLMTKGLRCDLKCDMDGGMACIVT